MSASDRQQGHRERPLLGLKRAQSARPLTPHVLLAAPDVRRLLASVLAVVERESGHEAALKRNLS